MTGILKDMYDTFAADLEKSNQDESNAQMGFEEVMAEKEKKNQVLKNMATPTLPTHRQKSALEKKGKCCRRHLSLAKACKTRTFLFALAELWKCIAGGQVTEKSAEKAEKSKMLAENEELLEATTAQLKEDEEFFAVATESSPRATSTGWEAGGKACTKARSAALSCILT